MYLTRNYRNNLFKIKSKILNKFLLNNRYSLSFYIKCLLLILILYNINIFIGFNSNKWFEKSFENEYHLKMIHIDVTKIEENVENVLGVPKNILSNEFLIKNPYLCGYSINPETLIYPQLIILIKSNIENFKERQAIRMTWGNKFILLKQNVRLAFVLGKNYIKLLFIFCSNLKNKFIFIIR